MKSRLKSPLMAFLLAGALSLALTACKSETRTAHAAGFAAPSVQVVEAKPENVPIYSEYVAQTFARDMVEVRGRVDGYIEKRLFQTGQDVRAGETLYVLDRRPYQADVQKAQGDVAQAEANLEFASKQVALAQAQADLAQAQANMVKAQQDVDRLEPLVQQDAAAKQDLDNAVQALKANQANVKAKEVNVEQIRLSTQTQIDTAKAQVESNRALLRTADLNLGYATIGAPIGGRIGDSLIPVGGLVSKTSSQPLTTIVPLDPMWVRFQISESEYLKYKHRKDLENIGQLPVELMLADNSIYPREGRIRDTDNQVDPKTGTLQVQATFPNPDHRLLPGQFGRIRLKVDEQKGALLVPQRAVQELQGTQSVLTVGPENKVQVRTVVPGERIGERWVILQGLKPGDRVIVEGVQKARPGTPVNPQPYKPVAGS